MYIDARKFDYKAFGYNDADTRVQRDKAFAKRGYEQWFTKNVDGMVNRQWEIDDIGVVERTGDFVRLLREAEFTYSIGAYTSTMALIGVCAEDLCRFLIESDGQQDKSKDQATRIDTLHTLGIVDAPVKQLLHTIRKLRNDCLHFNQAFKAKAETTLQSEALTALNALKRTYGALVGATDYKTIDGKKFGKLLEAMAIQTKAEAHPTGVAGHAAMQARLRNLFANAFGMDLSLDDPTKTVMRMSIFHVEEVDPNWTPPEMTLVDQVLGVPVIVDLDDADLANLRKQDVTAGDLIAVSLKSVPDGLGMTSAWRLASTPQKMR
ncbi:MAG: DUF4145 domain-containing protein [Thermoplasmatota archaeon]